jgi:hypothetical protein
MFSLIKTNEHLAEALESAGLEFSDAEDGSFSIEPYKVNIWVRLCQEDQILYMNTFWPVRLESRSDDVLRLVNKCNQVLSIGQFCLNPDGDRLCGFYQILSKDGIDPKLFLRSAAAFATNFYRAINELDEDDLIGLSPEIEAALHQRELCLLH